MTTLEQHDKLCPCESIQNRLNPESVQPPTSSNLSILLVEHNAQVCEVEHGQESEDEVDEDGHEVALLVLEVDSRLAPRTHGRVEDGRQLLPQP